MIRAHVFFSGTVQGVGFRYTCRDYAVNLGLKGWVKNLPDGRVELVVEGPKDDVKATIKRIETHFDGFIRDTNVDYSNADGQFENFKIVF